MDRCQPKEVGPCRAIIILMKIRPDSRGRTFYFLRVASSWSMIWLTVATIYSKVIVKRTRRGHRENVANAE